ncbi:hypothetical protein CEXT_471291 [Caerostris extrusa]|uniref:Uncharacterized protein n=1 Tax=Caerostris extrusa TaxID=172846 RepID=A0AAV4YGU0_CAEEX|nr:hypothetical protein CEXT_471291 [Caerostris extrusa]
MSRGGVLIPLHSAHRVHVTQLSPESTPVSCLSEFKCPIYILLMMVYMHCRDRCKMLCLFYNRTWGGFSKVKFVNVQELEIKELFGFDCRESFLGYLTFKNFCAHHTLTKDVFW